jgi:hypothetical protein
LKEKNLMSAAESRPTKNQKRQDARDKARALREKQSKNTKRNKVLTQASLAIGVVGVIALVTVFIISSLRPPGPGPANMQSDGITIGEGLNALRTPAMRLPPRPSPMPTVFQRSAFLLITPALPALSLNPITDRLSAHG